MDLTPITTPLVEFAGTFVMAAAPILTAWALAELRKRTGIAATAQQQATLAAAESTAVGIIQTDLATGNAKLADISTSHPSVQKAVQYLDTMVPEAMRFFGISPQDMAQKLVGKLGSALATDPTVPTVAPSDVSVTQVPKVAALVGAPA